MNAKQIYSGSGLISDEYFDISPSYFMLLNDYLLRRRVKCGCSGMWQLKYPASKLVGKLESIQNMDNYLEVNEASQIIQIVSDLAKKFVINKEASKCKTVESLVDTFQMGCYAPIKSTRKSYLIDNFRIDLDETDFGYKLGEIEVLLNSDANTPRVEDSIKQIKDLIASLGLGNKNFLFIIIIFYSVLILRNYQVW